MQLEKLSTILKMDSSDEEVFLFSLKLSSGANKKKELGVGNIKKKE